MGKEDDIISEGYQYQWSLKSESSLQEFLAKYKPSMVQNDGTKPWLWVHKSDTTPGTKGDEEGAKEATALLSQITERVKEIQDDASIPIRANKKKGLKSKKELREQVQHEATEKLKDIASKHGCVVGKWLIFAQPDRVDALWNSIATSLVSGSLSSTSAYLAKVATSPQNDTPNYSHLVCVYVPDVYDQLGVTEVMKVLLRNHGVNLMGVKSNLYTSIGIDSKHPSGIPSTVWKNTALMKDTEIKALKEEYFAELNDVKTAAAEETAAKKAASGETKKPRPKLKKKGGDDPFASHGEDGEEKAAAMPSGVKGEQSAPKKNAAAEVSASDEDIEEQSPKAKTKALPKKRAPKRAKAVDEDESEDEAPKKKRGRA